MCMGSKLDTPKTPAPPAAAPPAPAPTVLQTAASEGAGGGDTASNSKGRKALRINLASSNVGGPSGLNLPL